MAGTILTGADSATRSAAHGQCAVRIITRVVSRFLGSEVLQIWAQPDDEALVISSSSWRAVEDRPQRPRVLDAHLDMEAVRIHGGLGHDIEPVAGRRSSGPSSVEPDIMRALGRGITARVPCTHNVGHTPCSPPH